MLVRKILDIERNFVFIVARPHPKICDGIGRQQWIEGMCRLRQRATNGIGTEGQQINGSKRQILIGALSITVTDMGDSACSKTVPARTPRPMVSRIGSKLRFRHCGQTVTFLDCGQYGQVSARVRYRDRRIQFRFDEAARNAKVPVFAYFRRKLNLYASTVCFRYIQIDARGAAAGIES